MRRALRESDNKYSRGIVAVVAGSASYPGAAILTVGGARRGNAGYVKFLSNSPRLIDQVISNFPDVVPIKSLLKERFDSLVVGPGGSKVSELPDVVPVVLDSAAMTMALKKGKRRRGAITVVTPHEGELRYLGISAEELDRSGRAEVARDIARTLEIFVVLKGNRTVITSPTGETIIDKLGGAELATAGSGDLLAGLIASFLVAAKEGQPPLQLIHAAVDTHSRAGRAAAKRFTSVTAVEIMDSLAVV